MICCIIVTHSMISFSNQYVGLTTSNDFQKRELLIIRSINNNNLCLELLNDILEITLQVNCKIYELRVTSGFDLRGPIRSKYSQREILTVVLMNKILQTN